MIEEVDTGMDVDGKDLFQVTNVGDGWVRGVELEQRVSLYDLLIPGVFTVRATQTFIDSQLEDDAGNKRRFSQQADFVGNLGLFYEHAPSATRISANANYVSDTFKNSPGKKDVTDDELFIDLYAETRLYKNINIFGQVQNLTKQGRDKRKVEGSKVEIESEETGRTFLIGLRATF